MQKEWIINAIERAKLFGMLNYLPGGELNHIPFSLSPFPISKSILKVIGCSGKPFKVSNKILAGIAISQDSSALISNLMLQGFIRFFYFGGKF